MQTQCDILPATAGSRLSAEVWTAGDGNIGKRRWLRDMDDALFLQHQQCVELRSGVLARDLARRNYSRELCLGSGAGTTELSSQHLVHFSRMCSATVLHLLSIIQLFQLQMQPGLLILRYWH